MIKKNKRTSDEIPEEMEFGELDIYNLHEEWQKQDKLVGFYGKKLALARRKYEEAVTASKVFEAETARRVRRKPQNYGVKRLTEGAIKEAVSIEVLTSKQHDETIRLKYRVEMLEVAMKRLEHRKKGIGDCVWLHSQQYYAEPTVPKKYQKYDRDPNKDDKIGGLKRKYDPNE